MKSHFLTDVANADAARAALDRLLPSQRDPWVLFDGAGDAIAYFNADGDGITVDISGRHFNEDAAVIGLLEAVQREAGGAIESDD
jgi:hypothetical protein